MPLILLDDMMLPQSGLSSTVATAGISSTTYVNSAPGVPAPLPATGLNTTFGQTILAIGVIPGLDQSVYYSPIVVNSTASAANYYGFGRMTRAIGEMQRQGAPSIIAIACQVQSDLANLFDYVADLDYDVVVPVGQTATPDLIQQFAAFGYQREQQSQPVMIVLSADPGATTDVSVNSPPGIYAPTITTNDIPIASSRYFVFTLDTITVNPNVPSQYTADLAPSLAGLMVKNLPNVSITGETLTGITASNLYSAADALALSNAGYTVLRQTTRHGLVPYLGVTGTSTLSTMANYGLGYHKISTMRCAQYVTSSIQAATSNLIGEPSGSAVTDIVTKLMASLQAQNIIVSYSFNISIQQAAGSVTIGVSILPPYETTMITVTAQVNYKAS